MRFNSYTFDIPIIMFKNKVILRILNVKCIDKALISLKSISNVLNGKFTRWLKLYKNCANFDFVSNLKDDFCNIVAHMAYKYSLECIVTLFSRALTHFK